MNMTWVPVAVFLCTLSCAPGFSQGLGVAGSYNVFTFGDDTQSNTDAQGRVAVGGNANFTNYGVGSNLPITFNGNSLVVGQNLTYNGGQIYQGNGAVGGTVSVTGVGIAHGAISTSVHPIDFAAERDLLTNDSIGWSKLGGNSIGSQQYGVTLTSAKSDFDVFNLTSTELAGANGFGLTINGNANETILVNVKGSSIDLNNFDFSVHGTDQSHVLFNFADATSLSLTNVGFNGSILAPNASVDFGNGHINGSMIVGALHGNGEAHDYLFAGIMPKPVPEAGTIALMGMAVLSLSAVLLRKRAA